jgi:hypothetical protein
MESNDDARESGGIYPAGIVLPAATTDRNRLTVAFRFFLALPHFILIGGPIAGSVGWSTTSGSNWSWGSGYGLLGLAVWCATVFAWFAILITARHPDVLWRFGAYYLRWRVRAIAYMTLLRDEYPPFGDGDYPAELLLERPAGDRDRVTVLLRLLLVIPHIILLALLGALWALSTAIAWIVILVTGRFPETLYGFALGVLAWDIRVEAYVLLLRDEYPPFTLRV